jgi:hypothetical protein
MGPTACPDIVGKNRLPLPGIQTRFLARPEHRDTDCTVSAAEEEWSLSNISNLSVKFVNPGINEAECVTPGYRLYLGKILLARLGGPTKSDASINVPSDNTTRYSGRRSQCQRTANGELLLETCDPRGSLSTRVAYRNIHLICGYRAFTVASCAKGRRDNHDLILHTSLYCM